MDIVSSDSSRGGIWWQSLSGLLLLLIVWGVLPGPVWPQAQEAGFVALQRDGKIVATASGGFAVARYLPDGSLDPSFGRGGKVVTQLGTARRVGDKFFIYDGAGFVVLQEDGKIVAAGRSDKSLAVVRYLPNGDVDPSFGTEGKVKTWLGAAEGLDDELHALALQADGKIVAVGRAWQQYSNDIAVVRFNADGTLDSSFGDEGKVTTNFLEPGPPNASSPGPTSGYGLGSKDTAHSSGPPPASGRMKGQDGYDDAFAAGIEADGKLVVGGTSLVRYNPDGTLDTSFGSGGRVMTEVHALVLQRDDKIVVVGAAGAFALARYNSDGTLDASFGVGGTVTTKFGKVDEAGSMALQVDGKLVVVGKSFNGRSVGLAMARYNPDGTLDTSFGKEGRVTSDSCAYQVE